MELLVRWHLYNLTNHFKKQIMIESGSCAGSFIGLFFKSLGLVATLRGLITMSFANDNTEDPIIIKKGVEVDIELRKSGKIIKKKKASTAIEKSYSVTVTYIQLTNEEAKIKRAIIETILKKGLG